MFIIHCNTDYRRKKSKNAFLSPVSDDTHDHEIKGAGLQYVFYFDKIYHIMKHSANNQPL